MRTAIVVAILLSLSAPALCGAADDFDVDAFNRCLLEKIETAGPTTTVQEIREACLIEVQHVGVDSPLTTDAAEETAEEETPLNERIEGIRATQEMDFVITPYRPNYILVGANPDPNTAPFEEAFPDENINFEPAEIKFQISFMFPVVHDIFGDNGSLYFAYTNRSFWQVFANDLSSPFRETNHQPEFWLSFESDREILGFTNRLNVFGFDHQSNGRNEPLSRSWNRIFARFIFEKGIFVMSLKPWIIVGDLSDNQDIQDYMGNLEFRGVVKLKRHTVSLMLRNNLQSNFSKGTFQVDWSFPIYHRLRGYTQYFNGYGESLIDYNVHTNTIGAGLEFTDYF